MPERQLSYHSIENKKHAGYVVTAPSWQRIYIESGLALTDQLVDLDLVQEREKKTLTVSHKTKETLLVAFIDGLLVLFENEKFLSRRIVFSEFDGQKISATLFGEKYDPIRHGHASDIKSEYEKQVEMGDSQDVENHFFAKVVIRN